MKKYIIVQATSLIKLQEKVNLILNEYKPIGTVFITIQKEREEWGHPVNTIVHKIEIYNQAMIGQ